MPSIAPKLSGRLSLQPARQSPSKRAAEWMICFFFMSSGGYSRFSVSESGSGKMCIRDRIFNSALFQKVENIGTADVFNNQDKRALYDRWSPNNTEAYFLSLIHI